MKYNGFYIDKKYGNNAFSYKKRSNKKIYIPSVKKLDYDKKIILENLEMSNNIAFCEYDDELEKEFGVFGIKNFIFSTNKEKKLYIYDNHNHCFYFLCVNILNNIRKKYNISENTNILTDFLNKKYEYTPKTMIHFDQHKDMRVPDSTFLDAINFIKKNKDYFYKDSSDNKITDNTNISLYTNYFLNVGNFIVPLIENNFIEDVKIIDSSYSMDELYKNINDMNEIILDIDLDFFSEDMSYIDEDYSIEIIKKCYDKANTILICTSPYFIEFDRAKKYLEKILSVCM